MPKIIIRELYGKGTEIDKRGVPVFGDYLAGMWGGDVVGASRKLWKTGLRIKKEWG